MDDLAAARAAANSIWGHWQAGTVLDNLPDACRPQSRAEGYAAQAQLPAVSGRRVAGWKIAATSAAGQAHIRVSGPIAGRILQGQMFEPGATLPAAGNFMRVAEPEIAFTFARDLPPRGRPYEVAEVVDAAGTLHTAIEVPSSRFADFAKAGEAQLLADDACAHHFILGPAVSAGWRSLDLAAHRVRGTVTRPDGSHWTRDGSGAAVLGDPRRALAWLVNELTGLGTTLRAGEFVTTGTCMQPLELQPGDVVDADYGALGRLGMRFGA